MRGPADLGIAGDQPVEMEAHQRCGIHLHSPFGSGLWGYSTVKGGAAESTKSDPDLNDSPLKLEFVQDSGSEVDLTISAEL